MRSYNFSPLLKGVQEAERALAAVEMIGNGVIADRAYAMTGANAATVAYAQNLGVASAAELTFGQKVAFATANLRAQVAAWAKTPVGTATIAAAAIFAVVKAFDALNISHEEAIENHDELASKYQTTASELETLQTELTEVRNRLEELNKVEDPSLVDPEELEKLKESEESLARQVKYKEMLADYEKGQAADAAYSALTNRPWLGFGDDMLTDAEQLRKDVETHEQLIANTYDKLAKLEPGSAQFNSAEAELEKLQDALLESQGAYAEKMLEIESLYNSLVDSNGNALKDSYEDLVAELKILLDIDEASADQAVEDAGDIAGQVSDTINKNTKEAFSSDAQEKMDEAVNGFQTSLS